MLFIVGDFFRRRRQRPRDDWPAEPLLRMLVFWVLFGLGALIGAFAIVAGMTGRWLVAAAAGTVTIGSIAGAIVTFRKLNRLD